MFTGIVETLGTIARIEKQGSNVDFWVNTTITNELKIDQSVAHNGVCLTVVAIDGDTYKVTAVAETLEKTNLGQWQGGRKVNIERSLRVGDRLDGHFVQGHVDATATCVEKQTLDGSWLFRFRFPKEFASLIIEKGSVCINGTSLTVFNVGKDEFTVTIIPYTYDHTNFHELEEGHLVNIEFDVLGKYLLRQQQLQSA
ncbi:riboflavin synthase [Taibaiella soli]|uniref:Riboflavin synthase n=1 Tax=Taibaiella soli TaxID=1649169 RepID=A0A2W2BSX3_9BACT|nr:riboflavin synthase [Taibaiella soli]PZF70843.1 riboflavin synthase [Taibaiella soli]